MKFIFPVAIYKDIEFEVTEQFMDFFKNFCEDSYEELKATTTILKSTSYSSIYQELMLKRYEILKNFSKEDIEHALSNEDECVKEWFDTLRGIINTYLEQEKGFYQDSCEWESEYEIIEE